MNNKKCDELLEEFNVKTEQELFDLLIKESSTIPCQICGREIPIESLCFIDGDPFCLNCISGLEYQ
jgi:RNA polymerase-binding transcription factor DksA